MKEQLQAWLGKAPLSYFWAVEYEDSTAISQFDPLSGLERQWSDVLGKNKRVKTVYWLPFSRDFAKKVFKRCDILCVSIPTERRMMAHIPPGGNIIIKRKGFIPLGVGSSGRSERKAYVLGFEKDGEIAVIARDEKGANIDPAIVARWMRGISKTDDKGKLSEGD